ncbi:MAG: T9SS type A sorting domain-containing protein [Bacteroidales bacterium]|nr:T9SS type A sorting domain-containing protein [Bacteroidales bacterium]
MKVVSSIIFVYLLSINLLAQQNTWQYMLSTVNEERSIGIAEGDDGMINVGGYTEQTSQANEYQALVLKLDPNGYFVDSIHYNFDNKSTLFADFLEYDSKQFILLSTFKEPSANGNNGGFLVSLLDTDLNLTETKVFYADTNYRILGVYGDKSSDGHLFLSLAMNLTGVQFHSYLIEMDDNFNILKQRLLTDNSSAYQKLRKISDSSYWSINVLNNKYEIFDSELIKVNDQRIPEHFTSIISVKWDSDSSFYVLGDHIISESGHSHNLGFLKQFHPIDTSGYLFNHWRLTDTVDVPAFFNGIDFISKDSIFMGGTRNLPIVIDPYHFPQTSWFVILQTDSLLNVRWERFYGGNANYLMTNLIATRDGGCLIAGTRYDYMNDPVPQTDIIVLKLNSEGLLVGNNEQPETRMHEAIIFPNPGTEALQVRLAVQHPTALLELFDTNGRLVFSQQLHQKENRIAVGHLPAGTYIYNLSADTGLRESGKWVKL